MRALAEVGLAEEAPELAKDRRERWWRLVASSLRWSGEALSDDPAGEDTAAPAGVPGGVPGGAGGVPVQPGGAPQGAPGG